MAPGQPSTRFAQRLSVLEQAVETARQRLTSQEEALGRLKSGLGSLRGEHDEIRRRAQTALRALKELPAAARPDTHPLPSPIARPTLSIAVGRPSRAPIWTWLPIVAIAAFGLVVAAGAPTLRRPHAPVAPPSVASAPPLAAPVPPDFSAGADRTVSEREADEALKLVYAYVPAGAARNVRQILEGPIVAASETEPWVMEKEDDGRVLATLRPGADAEAGAPIYEFEVDLRRRLVEPSQETEAGLKTSQQVASRD